MGMAQWADDTEVSNLHSDCRCVPVALRLQFGQGQGRHNDGGNIRTCSDRDRWIRRDQRVVGVVGDAGDDREH